MAAAAPPVLAAAKSQSPSNFPHDLFVYPDEETPELSVHKVYNTYTHPFFSVYLQGVHTTGVQNTTSNSLLRIIWTQKFI